MHFKHQRSPSPGYSPKANLREQCRYQKTVHQGSLLCGRVRSPITLPGLNGGKIVLSFTHFAGNMPI